MRREAVPSDPGVVRFQLDPRRLELAILVDGDEWRNEVRRAALRLDHAFIKKAAAKLDLSTAPLESAQVMGLLLFVAEITSAALLLTPQFGPQLGQLIFSAGSLLIPFFGFLNYRSIGKEG